jgi:regulator of sigma E protease
MSIISILSVIFAFSLLVIIHELGHFLAARWMGVRVEKFSIGFPPTLFSKKIGETEFTISAIPLGGYVKMAGFIDESMDTKITGSGDEYSSKPVWKRMIIITAGVIMNLILAIVIYSFLNFYQGETQNPTTKVMVAGNIGVAEKIGFKSNDQIKEINGNPVEYWGQIHQAFFQNIDKGVQFTVIREGQQIILNYDPEWFKEQNGELLNIAPLYEARVGETIKGMSAEEVGLLRGDLILNINGTTIANWDEMTSIVRNNPGNELSIEWLRDGKIMQGIITPKNVNIQNEDGITNTIGQVGIYPYVIKKPVSIAQAIIKGLYQPFEIIYMNIKGFQWMISGTKPVEDSLAGPATIAKLISDSAHRGWEYYMTLIATLSSVLAFFNILPIPALDGGHLAFLFIEAVMGKPLSVKTRVVVQQVGMAVLLSLIVFVLYVDFNRLF